MPCCCETNLKAIFVLGILGAVFGCLALIFKNYAGVLGIVASICFIIGAKSPNPTALLAGMILAIIECVGMIIVSILDFVEAGDAATSTSSANSYLKDAGLTQNDLKGLSPKETKNIIGFTIIFGVVYTVGVIIFQIWVIMVANKARKEIDQGIKI